MYINTYQITNKISDFNQIKFTKHIIKWLYSSEDLFHRIINQTKVNCNWFLVNALSGLMSLCNNVWNAWNWWCLRQNITANDIWRHIFYGDSCYQIIKQLCIGYLSIYIYVYVYNSHNWSGLIKPYMYLHRIYICHQ